MAMSGVCVTPSTRSVSRASPSSRRGILHFPSRLSLCKAQYIDAATTCIKDLSKGTSFPVGAGLAVALTSTAAARAEELAETTTVAGGEVVPAAAASGSFGSGEAVLLLTPVIVYALFNVYRDRINPQAKFLDYIYIMAALAIFGNIFSILIFKTRFF